MAWLRRGINAEGRMRKAERGNELEMVSHRIVVAVASASYICTVHRYRGIAALAWTCRRCMHPASAVHTLRRCESLALARL